MALSKDAVYNALKGYKDPYFKSQDIVERKAVQEIMVNGSNVKITIALGYPARSMSDRIKQEITELILPLDADAKVEVELNWAIEAARTQNNLPSMHKVKNIIAVASGKGGVGKSTTSVNIALALVQEGAKVGILDADIYGPSVPVMLGIDENQRPDFVNEKYFNPIFVHGLQSMSMGYMVTDKTPMVWRGPMVSGALQQLLTQCMWHELDYLIIDMPPGTGDIQLTLSQKVPVTGAVIVTTPQDVATLDAKKGIEMFRKVDIPVLGVVENMAIHVCSNCGHKEHIFGSGGGERIAEEYNANFLGALPLDLSIRENADKGEPIILAQPDSDIAKTYRDIACKMAVVVAEQGKNEANSVVNIIATD